VAAATSPFFLALFDTENTAFVLDLMSNLENGYDNGRTGEA
jgi:hypothetical protein